MFLPILFKYLLKHTNFWVTQNYVPFMTFHCVLIMASAHSIFSWPLTVKFVHVFTSMTGWKGLSLQGWFKCMFWHMPSAKSSLDCCGNTAPHPPAHLCRTWTYDLSRLSVKVHRCQNWHTDFSTKWMPYHGMCRSILHTTQTYCQVIVKSLDSWKMPSYSRWMIFRGLWFSGTRVNACGDFFCLLHYHRLWAFLKGFHVSSLKYVSGILVISTMWTSVCIIYIC
jgi:hypothetical protein